MDLIFKEDGTLEIRMKKMLEDILKLVDEPLSVSVSSPATKRLHEVTEDSEQLDETQSELFHSSTAKLLYVYKRSRPDI